MSRKPRPTLAQLDSLQRRYDAVVATLHRVHGERETLKRQIENLKGNARFELTVAANRIANLESAVKEMTPLTLSELFRVLWNGLRGKGWHRRPEPR